jgi:hypothetical protein
MTHECDLKLLGSMSKPHTLISYENCKYYKFAKLFMMGKHLLYRKRLNNCAVYLNTVMSSFIGYMTKNIMEIFKQFQFIQL